MPGYKLVGVSRKGRVLFFVIHEFNFLPIKTPKLNQSHKRVFVLEE